MAFFGFIAILAVLAYLYGQKRKASQRLCEAVNLTLAEAQENMDHLDAGEAIRRDRFDGARSGGAFDTAPIHLIAALHQAYDMPSRSAFERAVAQLVEYRSFRGWPEPVQR